MSIQLTDINHDDQPPAGAHRDPIGVVILDKDGWSASCPEIGVRSEGAGRPTELEGGITWVSNLGFHDARGVRAAQSRGDVSLRGKDWIFPKIDEALDDWGARSYARKDQADIMATLLNRVMRLSYETVRTYLGASPSKEQAAFKTMETSPSLPNGLRNAMGAAIDQCNPSDKKTSARITDSIKYGAYVLRENRVEEGEIFVSLRAPRLVHALDVLQRPVPAPGKWQESDLGDRVLSENTVAKLHDLDRPVLLYTKAVPKNRTEDAFLSSWTVPMGPGRSRSFYTLEEVRAMKDAYDFMSPHATVGPGWRSSSGLEMLRALITISGYDLFAHTSWSVGVVAENILRGVMRSGLTKNRDTEAVVSPESVWVAANDRVAMLPMIRKMEDYGVIVSSGYAGDLGFKFSSDPEMATMVATGAWESGLHMQVQTAVDMRRMGVEPPCDKESYGGSHLANLQAIMSQGGKVAPFWKIDEMNDKVSGERAAAFRDFLGI